MKTSKPARARIAKSKKRNRINAEIQNRQIVIIRFCPTTQRRRLVLTLPAIWKHNFRLMSSIRPKLLGYVLGIFRFVVVMNNQAPNRENDFFLRFSGQNTTQYC